MSNPITPVPDSQALSSTGKELTIKRSGQWKRIFICLVISSLSLFIISTVFFISSQIPPVFSWYQGYQDSLNTLGISGIFTAVVLFCCIRIAFLTNFVEPLQPLPQSLADEGKQLDETVTGILLAEFEYGRQTAGEAMEGRDNTINFYLLIAGGATSGVIGFLGSISNRNELSIGATALLWLVSLIGWLTLFKLISFRIAWVGSVVQMNVVKSFYIKNMNLSKEKSLEKKPPALQSAFLFRSDTIPGAGKHWNVYHYSALLVVVLDAVALFAGIILLGIRSGTNQIAIIALGGAIIAVINVLSHWWIYDASLSSGERTKKR